MLPSPRPLALAASALLLALPACGAPTAPSASSPTAGLAPLGIGGDYRSYRKVTTEPFLSDAHGGLWVDVYVNELGADAYVKGADVPVGTIVVKEGWLAEDGRPSTKPGPVFVMRLEPPGTTPPERAGWYYALWGPTPGGPVYWQGDDPHLADCWNKCHNTYRQGLGGLTPSSLVPR
ncbi:MAG: cytochrome P460 family protein [Kofleriaceae bacterium]